IGQRRAAFGAEAAIAVVRRTEALRLAARPGELRAAHGNERQIEIAARLLAHAAMADRRIPKRALDMKANRTALASAGVEGCAHRFTSHVVTRSPVDGSLPSLSWMPLAARSSRILSASVKFFAFSIS